MKPEINEVESATAQLARRSLVIATQEREAFGLRPSDSEEYRREYEKLCHHSRYESRLSESSLDDIDEPPDSSLSHEASHMFHSIQANSNSVEDSRSASSNNGFKRVSRVVISNWINIDARKLGAVGTWEPFRFENGVTNTVAWSADAHG
jgi:hypothetical protein